MAVVNEEKAVDATYFDVFSGVLIVLRSSPLGLNPPIRKRFALPAVAPVL